MFDEELTGLAERVLDRFAAKDQMLACAESCTGGLVAALLTSIAGSSEVLERGFVTYSNEAKSELIAVPAELIGEHGAVSMEVAMAMASGALATSRADAAVSITGIAGPGGGSHEKPVGLVFIAVAGDNGVFGEEFRFGADRSRDDIRRDAVISALEMVLAYGEEE